MAKFKLHCECTATQVSACDVEVDLPTDDRHMAEAWATVALHPDGNYRITGTLVRPEWSNVDDVKKTMAVKAEHLLEVAKSFAEEDTR